VVFVEQTDGSFKSTPFYVKFGKIGVLKAKEKTVEIEINGEELPLSMVLDDFGIAHFPPDALHTAPSPLPASLLNGEEREVSVHTGSESASPLKRMRRNSEPSLGETGDHGWDDPAREGGAGALCAASRALSNPDLMADSSISRTSTAVGLSEEVLHLSPHQLSAYSLRPGINDATFSITTQFQGTAKVVSSILLNRSVI
jgi:phosphatidate phosphatase PAH1